MEHRNKTRLHLVTNNEPMSELATVAAAIRPVPPEVEPSQEFLGELRLRLLGLEPGRKVPLGDSQRAA